MPSICNVPRCDNHRYRNVRNNGVSVFSVPRDPNLLSMWEKALSCKLNHNQGVCEVHFKPEDVKRSLKIRDQSGKIIQEEPYKKTHLARQAVPLGRKDYRDPILPMNTEIDDQKLDTDLTSIISGIHEYDNHPKEYCIQLISGDPENSSTNNETDQENTSNIELQKEVGNQIDLVSAIKNESLEITLPNRNWLCKTSKSGVLFALMEEETTPTKRTKLTVSLAKRVFLTNNTVSICIKNHSLDMPDLNYPQNASELEDILVRIDSLGICRGGPALNRTGTFSTAFAEEDLQTNRWRHKSCKIIFPFKEGTICMECCKLYAIFDEYKKRMESTVPEKSAKRCKTKMDFEFQHEFSEKSPDIYDIDLIAGQGNKLKRLPNILRSR